MAEKGCKCNRKISIDQILKQVSIWDKHMNVLRDYAEEKLHYSGIKELHFNIVITSFFMIREPYLLNNLDI
jgi:hypothetical protein